MLLSVLSTNASFCIDGFCDLLSSLRAKRKISFSICWSSLIYTVTWVIVLSFSFRASSTVAVIIDSASAHSCIMGPDTGGDGLNVTNRT